MSGTRRWIGVIATGAELSATRMAPPDRLHGVGPTLEGSEATGDGGSGARVGGYGGKGKQT